MSDEGFWKAIKTGESRFDRKRGIFSCGWGGVE